MNRCRPVKKSCSRLHSGDLKKTAIHESGHAAAIYLRNRQKRLPPIFFQIEIDAFTDNKTVRSGYFGSVHHFAGIKGGRLIHTLPASVDDELRELPHPAQQDFLQAFEADIVNFLVGPLAEAKYVALSLDEPMNHRLVNLDSLHYFGGSSDLKAVREYLDCWFNDPLEKEQKSFELFLAAYGFINDKNHWQVITALADYILTSGKNLMDCEEAIAVMEDRLALT